MSQPTSPQSNTVTRLDSKRRIVHGTASGMFAERLQPGSMRTVVLTTTDMERPLTIRVNIDVAQPADDVMYVLWAAAGLDSDSSALLSRYEQGECHQYFGVAAAWENSANRNAVHDLHAVQFGQLFLADTELYAELDPGRGWCARISLEPAASLGDEAVGDPGSAVQIVQDPFGIPPAMTARQTDVLLKASDGEQLTPLEQQMLVQLDAFLELPMSEVSQAIALATVHAVRAGVAPQHVNRIPFVMSEVPYAIPARELFRSLQASESGISVTKTGKIPAAELRNILHDPNMSAVLFDGADQPDLTRVQLSDVPLVGMAWDVLLETGLVTIAAQRAQLSPELNWLRAVTHEEFDSYFEAILLRYVVDHELIDVADDGPHPTLEYETAQEYADSLISSALAAPEQFLDEFLDSEMRGLFDPDEQREHLEFTIELLHVAEPVTRRMSVPCGANLHASIETILIMFGWDLTHLWQLDLMDSNGMRQPLAASYHDEYLEVPLAADMDVATVLRSKGSPVLLTYDFGDGWEMLIAPVGIRTAGAEAELLAAQGSCPPEDSGGPGGYEMKLLAVRDPAEFQRQYPDFESEEIRELGNWMRTHTNGRDVPAPDFYELDEYAMPYEF